MNKQALFIVLGLMIAAGGGYILYRSASAAGGAGSTYYDTFEGYKVSAKK